jgi:hypothetical protein
VHPLVQATADIVMVGFTFFLLAWIALAIMLVRETIAIFRAQRGALFRNPRGA